ncbi:MAG: DUF559 domain-containing protein [Euryarchaeota archaeon]|nr:DUF559 domain-containing protein [Euryarchaeota archaeon]MDE1836511.1 DUF559 domain-containing protein [Euryarchaeota archaeon]MDE1879294.1 DUF559 domain-containing protein [Euryarchaeota archaeon]MDE2044481.1 DUF559 domain-containing protein [Thermoplasmata archaeon]
MVKSSPQNPSSEPERILKQALDAAGASYAMHLGLPCQAIVDFAFPEVKLAVEVDGAQFHSTPRQRSRDAFRTHRLHQLGWRVIRFDAERVMKETTAVVNEIRKAASSAEGS